MTPELEIGLYIFMLAGFLGYHVITRIPPLLHTPLMSATNAMSGISLVGSLVVAGANFDPLSNLFGFVRRNSNARIRGRKSAIPKNKNSKLNWARENGNKL